MHETTAATLPVPDLLFQATHRFTFLEHVFPQYHGDPTPQTSSAQWSQHGQTMFVHAASLEEAKHKMKDFIIANPEKFSFWGKTAIKRTHEELSAYFEKALNNEPVSGQPLRVNQHCIEVEPVMNVIP